MKYRSIYLLILTYVIVGQNSSQGQFVKVNDINLYYEIVGEGPNLLVIHGNGGSIRSKDAMIKKLSESYRVIAFDSRGHGKSSDGNGDLNYRQMSDDIAKGLVKLNITDVNIYGHSDGGIIALILGFTHPELIQRMIVSGANYTSDEHGLEPELERMVERFNEIENPRLKRHIKLMAQFPTIKIDELKNIQAPVLILSGDRDAIQLEHTISMFRTIKNSQLCILPGTTHFIDKEKPDQLYLIITQFFTKPFTMPSTIAIAKYMEKQIFKKAD